jgi:hypothetical protein
MKYSGEEMSSKHHGRTSSSILGQEKQREIVETPTVVHARARLMSDNNSGEQRFKTLSAANV